ncbi:histidine kinase [Nakamurella endophytica]|uniref:Histidine kinase n=1 Tax=Nakamurella endophytica TaxID=1748367 RepID=A0A917WED3_9ACTN|nr:histidine kinase [Nakamurella endophytica]
MGTAGVRGQGTAGRDDWVRGRQRWMAGACVSLVFLVSGVAEVARADLPTWSRVLGVAAIVLYGALHVLGPAWAIGRPMPQRCGVLALQVLASLPMFLWLGPDTSILWIFVAAAAAMLLRAPAAVGVAAVLAGALLLVDHAGGRGWSWENAATLLALALFTTAFARNVRLSIELRRTREELAQAAVAAERERIGRDLHDILGHSLTAIAVKAGLARRLVGRDDAAAGAEVADLERLAREALADVRATASGFRQVSLAPELAVAAAVLRAADIRAELPTAVDDVDPAARELFGYVVREAVTNVVRHSSARTCRIRLTPTSVEVRDDGAGSAPTGDGSGLSGLRARVAAAGGEMTAGPVEGGFLVRVSVTGTARRTPPSAGRTPPPVDPPTRPAPHPVVPAEPSATAPRTHPAAPGAASLGA